MDYNDVIQIAIAYYKDKAKHEVMERFREESFKLLQADADARRLIAKEQILALAKLKIELAKFKFVYSGLQNQFGTVGALDNYIRSIETRIKLLSYEKNCS